MIFKILVAVWLFAGYGGCDNSRKNFLRVVKFLPDPPGSCILINCKPSKHENSYDCNLRYTKNKQFHFSQEHTIILHYKKSKGIPEDEYLEFNKGGSPTGMTASLKKTDGITVYIRKDAEGKIVEISCSIDQNKKTADVPEKLDKQCKFEGMKDVDIKCKN